MTAYFPVALSYIDKSDARWQMDFRERITQRETTEAWFGDFKE